MVLLSDESSIEMLQQTMNKGPTTAVFKFPIAVIDKFRNKEVLIWDKTKLWAEKEICMTITGFNGTL